MHAHMNRLKKISVADPTLFDAVPDLDPAFQSGSGSDFSLDAGPYLDPDPAPRQKDANLQIFSH
jgi:hypothetical protein